MADNQTNTIRKLLEAALLVYDSSINIEEGSVTYETVIRPVIDALSPDPTDTDLVEYLTLKLKQEYPSLELQDGDLIIDLLVRPLQILLEPIKREINLLRKRQSIEYVDEMTMDDAEDLASNFFITRKTGSIATGSVRVFFATPTFVTINGSVQFSTAAGLNYFVSSCHLGVAHSGQNR